jgi:hypothetical protein
MIFLQRYLGQQRQDWIVFYQQDTHWVNSFSSRALALFLQSLF